MLMLPNVVSTKCWCQTSTLQNVDVAKHPLYKVWIPNVNSTKCWCCQTSSLQNVDAERRLYKMLMLPDVNSTNVNVAKHCLYKMLIPNVDTTKCLCCQTSSLQNDDAAKRRLNKMFNSKTSILQNVEATERKLHKMSLLPILSGHTLSTKMSNT